MDVKKLMVQAVSVVVAGLFAGGCSSTYRFKVDAISNPEKSGHQSYKLVSSNAEVSEEDLQFKEVAAYVKTSLSSKGIYEAPNVESAEMIIDISYGVGEPQIDFKTYSSPVYAVTGGGYRTVMTQVMGPDGKVRTVATTIYTPPRREMVDMEERVVPITTYEKFLRLTARDNTEQDVSESPVQVWSIYVKSKDESDDLRKYIPLMAAASVPYVGENTDKQQDIKLKDTDDVVAFVKEGM